MTGSLVDTLFKNLPNDFRRHQPRQRTENVPSRRNNSYHTRSGFLDTDLFPRPGCKIDQRRWELVDEWSIDTSVFLHIDLDSDDVSRPKYHSDLREDSYLHLLPDFSSFLRFIPANQSPQFLAIAVCQRPTHAHHTANEDTDPIRKMLMKKGTSPTSRAMSHHYGCFRSMESGHSTDNAEVSEVTEKRKASE